MASIIPPAPIGAPFADYTWVDWYQKIRIAINEAADLKHNDLQDIQGGNATERFHLTNAEYQDVNELVNSYTVLVQAADLTSSSTTSIDAPNLQFVPEANSTYVADVYLMLETTVTTSAPRPGWLFSSDVVVGTIQIQSAASSTGATSRYGYSGNSDNGRSNHVQVSPTMTFDLNPFICKMSVIFRTGATPTAVGVTFASENVDTVTLLEGSTVVIKKVA